MDKTLSGHWLFGSVVLIREIWLSKHSCEFNNAKENSCSLSEKVHEIFLNACTIKKGLEEETAINTN